MTMETRIVRLISALRGRGVRVSLAESTEAFRAVEILGLRQRRQFRLSLRATLIKSARDLPIFDSLFPLFFGSNAPPMGGSLPDALTPDEARALAEALLRYSEGLRSQVERLISGTPLSEDELEGLGRLAGIGRLGDVRNHNWAQQRALRLLAVPEVQEALQETLEQLARRGIDAARIEEIAEMARLNLRSIQEQVKQFVGRRLAENSGRQPDQRVVEDLMDLPFDSLSEADKRQVQREVKRLAAALRTRIALRQSRAKAGQLDPKATIRANFKEPGSSHRAASSAPNPEAEARAPVRREHVDEVLRGTHAGLVVCDARTGPQGGHLCLHRSSGVDRRRPRCGCNGRGGCICPPAHAAGSLQH